MRLDAKKRAAAECDREAASIVKAKQRLERAAEADAVERKKLEHKATRMEKEAAESREHLARLAEEHPWIDSELLAIDRHLPAIRRRRQGPRSRRRRFYRGGGGDPGEPRETRQQEGDCDVRQGGGGVQGAPGEASHRAQRPFQDRVGDSRARREEEGGASRHVDQGERGLRVHLLHPPALHRLSSVPQRASLSSRGSR